MSEQSRNREYSKHLVVASWCWLVVCVSRGKPLGDKTSTQTCRLHCDAPEACHSTHGLRTVLNLDLVQYGPSPMMILGFGQTIAPNGMPWSPHFVIYIFFCSVDWWVLDSDALWLLVHWLIGLTHNKHGATRYLAKQRGPSTQGQILDLTTVRYDHNFMCFVFDYFGTKSTLRISCTIVT